MSKKPELSKELLEELLDYDPETGRLVWKWRDAKWFKAPLHCSNWNAQYAGKEAGTCFENKGTRYSRVVIFKVIYPTSTLVWVLSRGVWPQNHIVHVDGDTYNNRPENLEEAGYLNQEKPSTPRKCKEYPSQATLLSLLDYNPETGVLTWKERTDGSAKYMTRAGMPAGYTNPAGYMTISMNKQLFLVHRIIWKMVTGKDPKQTIDHINGIRNDNRWCNLREATCAENLWNMKTKRQNTSGHKNVSNETVSTGKPYRALVKKLGKVYRTPFFATPEEAAEEATKMRNELHGEYARHG